MFPDDAAADARMRDVAPAADRADSDGHDAPDDVPPLAPPTQRTLAIFGTSSCALQPNGRVYCWGENDQGQLGDHTTENRTRPVEVIGLTDVAFLGEAFEGACAVKTNGEVYCWGPWLVYLSMATPETMPVHIPELDGSIEVAGGLRFICGRQRNGTVTCVGDNMYGQRGIGSAAQVEGPTQVSGLVDAVQLTALEHLSCALRVDGTVVCWGTYWGGPGEPIQIQRNAPVQVEGLSNVVEVEYQYARTSAGEVWVWNASAAYCGIDSLELVRIDRLTNATDIAMANGGGCTLLATDEVVCWGDGMYGRLGDGTLTTRCVDLSRPVGGVSEVAELDSGGYHACVRQRSGRVLCWGWNAHGELGDGTDIDRRSAVEVQGL